MFGYLNRCEFIGHLGTDPEVETMRNGEKMVRFRLIVWNSWKDKNTGEYKKKTEWVAIVIMNQLICRIACDYLRKGSRIYISGQMQTCKWQDRNGVYHYITKVILQQFGSSLLVLDRRGDCQDKQIRSNRIIKRDSKIH